jgi:hypothetical protein
MEKKGDVLTRKTYVINGEMIELEGEKFIREKLGLPAELPKTAPTSVSEKVEPCKAEPAADVIAPVAKKP